MLAFAVVLGVLPAALVCEYIVWFRLKYPYPAEKYISKRALVVMLVVALPSLALLSIAVPVLVYQDLVTEHYAILATVYYTAQLLFLPVSACDRWPVVALLLLAAAVLLTLMGASAAASGDAGWMWCLHAVPITNAWVNDFALYTHEYYRGVKPTSNTLYHYEMLM